MLRILVSILAFSILRKPVSPLNEVTLVRLISVTYPAYRVVLYINDQSVYQILTTMSTNAYHSTFWGEKVQVQKMISQ